LVISKLSFEKLLEESFPACSPASRAATQAESSIVYVSERKVRNFDICIDAGHPFAVSKKTFPPCNLTIRI
jgi:hypothetical protein